MKFSYQFSNVGKYKTIIIKNRETKETAEIALRGVTLLKYLVDLSGIEQDIIDGFQNEEEISFSKGARCWIMTPFSNRIENGLYNFQGHTYQIFPVPPRDIVIHGFTSLYDFEIIKIEQNNEHLEIEFFTDILRKGNIEGYPFNVDVYIKLKFSNHKLEIFVKGKNIDDKPVPFFSGWHPYYKTGPNGIEHLILGIEAKKMILTDERGIPLKDELAYQEIKENSEYDFSLSKFKTINNFKLDKCFTDLDFDQFGISKSFIYDPINKLKIEFFQRGGHTLIFSGDSLKFRPRKSIAIEPVQEITNAFNRQETQNKITIYPGEESEFYFGFEVIKNWN